MLSLEDNLGNDEKCTFRVRERERERERERDVCAFSGVVSFQVAQW